MVYQLGECIVGDEQITIGQKIGLSDSLRVYSGISKELDQLIEIIGSTKKLSDQQKMDFYSIYNRFVTFLTEDSGLIQHYFLKYRTTIIHSKLQKLIQNIGLLGFMLALTNKSYVWLSPVINIKNCFVQRFYLSIVNVMEQQLKLLQFLVLNLF
jgi:hypothetical protein